MKKIIFAFLFIYGFSFSNGQNLENTLINDDFEEVFLDGFGLSGANEKQMQELKKTDLNLYYFDLVYNGEVIYRDAIRKSAGEDGLNEGFRDKYTIVINSEKFSSDDLVTLLEDRKNMMVKKGETKYLQMNLFKLVEYKNREPYPVSPLENLKVNIYRIEDH